MVILEYLSKNQRDTWRRKPGESETSERKY